MIAVWYTAGMRIVLPLIGVALLCLFVRGLLPAGKPTPYARMTRQSGGNNPEGWSITTGEVLIGSHPGCDVVLTDEGVELRHAVLTLENGQFRVTPVKGKPLLVNGRAASSRTRVKPGDRLTVGAATVQLTAETSLTPRKRRRLTGRLPSLLLLTLFQLLVLGSLLLHGGSEQPAYPLLVAFGALLLAEWIYGLTLHLSAPPGVELPAFFLTTLGFCVAADVGGASLLKQTVCFAAGFAGFLLLCRILRYYKLTMVLRYVAAALALVLLMLNLVKGTTINGSRNWLTIAGFSFQPSELIKVAFVFATAAPLDRMLSARHYWLFLAFSGCCLGALALMRDFGTAAIYFLAVLTVMGMRLADRKWMIAFVAAALAAIAVVLAVFPYVMNRFASYRHAWELANGAGYQQTRTMMAIASGGLLGLGGGNGNLIRITAAETDLVFGVLCEEWGLIVALCAVCCFLLLAVYAYRRVLLTHSAYYATAAGAAAVLFLFQTALNLFGSVDLLPLTGVTMPFVSNGGTSMIASWLLLAFLRMVDLRDMRVVLARPHPKAKEDAHETD